MINVCSEKPVVVSALVQKFVELSGMFFEVRVCKNRLKSLDVPVYYNSAEKLLSISGTILTTDLDETLEEILRDLVDRLQNETSVGSSSKEKQPCFCDFDNEDCWI